jgi:hypothetical protein
MWISESSQEGTDISGSEPQGEVSNLSKESLRTIAAQRGVRGCSSEYQAWTASEHLASLSI